MYAVLKSDAIFSAARISKFAECGVLCLFVAKTVHSVIAHFPDIVANNEANNMPRVARIWYSLQQWIRRIH